MRAENRAAGRLYRISTAPMAERELQDVVQPVTEESTAPAGAQFGAFFYNELDARGESYMLSRRRDDLALLVARVTGY